MGGERVKKSNGEESKKINVGEWIKQDGRKLWKQNGVREGEK